MMKKIVEDMHDEKFKSASMCKKSGQDSKLLTGAMKSGGHAGHGKNGYENATSSGKTFSSGKSDPLVRG